MAVWTIVQGSFSALHAPFGGELHGHDWTVRAELARGRKEVLQQQLDTLLAAIDHTNLVQTIGSDTTSEGVAAWLGSQLRARAVEVWRIDQGRPFGARWETDGAP